MNLWGGWCVWLIYLYKNDDSNEFMSRSKMCCFPSSLAAPLRLYEEVSWRRADAELITMATDVDTWDVGYTEQTDPTSSLATVQTVSPEDQKWTANGFGCRTSQVCICVHLTHIIQIIRDSQTRLNVSVSSCAHITKTIKSANISPPTSDIKHISHLTSVKRMASCDWNTPMCHH